ncbi:hypothetical protein P4414_27645, partial [Bacillus thuringiensis]|nr:hypothetical protein [Bacillus thuringiensis]
MLNKLNTGDLIKVYFAGTLEGQGNYIGIFQDQNSSFLSWKNDQGNEVYTSISSISIEILKRSNSHNIVSNPDSYNSNSHQNHETSYPDSYN